MRASVTVGVVGMGSTGTALARSLSSLAGCELRWIADSSRRTLFEARSKVPGARAAGDINNLLADEDLDAVVIAAPPAVRYELTHRALEAGKHVLVEPPAALDSAQLDDLLACAELHQRRLHMADRALFEAGLCALRELIGDGRLGDLYYLDVSRRGMGEGRAGREGILWDSGAAAVAAVLWLLADEPVQVTAHGGCSQGDGPPDIAFCHLEFATGVAARVGLSAVEPLDARLVTAVGSGGMARVDELSHQQPLLVTEHSRGDVVAPRLPTADPQTARCAGFLSSISAPSYSVPGDREGAAVVAVIEALERSLDEGGRPQPLSGPAGVDSAADAVARPPLAAVTPLPLQSM